MTKTKKHRQKRKPKPGDQWSEGPGLGPLLTHARITLKGLDVKLCAQCGKHPATHTLKVEVGVTHEIDVCGQQCAMDWADGLGRLAQMRPRLVVRTAPLSAAVREVWKTRRGAQTVRDHAVQL